MSWSLIRIFSESKAMLYAKLWQNFDRLAIFWPISQFRPRFKIIVQNNTSTNKDVEYWIRLETHRRLLASWFFLGGSGLLLSNIDKKGKKNKKNSEKTKRTSWGRGLTSQLLPRWDPGRILSGGGGCCKTRRCKICNILALSFDFIGPNFNRCLPLSLTNCQ